MGVQGLGIEEWDDVSPTRARDSKQGTETESEAAQPEAPARPRVAIPEVASAQVSKDALGRMCELTQLWGLPSSQWLRIVQAGYGERPWGKALGSSPLTVVEGFSRAEGSYVHVSDGTSVDDLVDELSAMIATVRDSTSFAAMKKANKARLQFKAIVSVSSTETLPEDSTTASGSEYADKKPAPKHWSKQEKLYHSKGKDTVPYPAKLRANSGKHRQQAAAAWYPWSSTPVQEPQCAWGAYPGPEAFCIPEEMVPVMVPMMPPMVPPMMWQAPMQREYSVEEMNATVQAAWRQAKSGQPC